MTEELLLVPVDETIVFPEMTVSLPIDDVAVGERVLLVPRDADGTWANVGTVAEVSELARLPRGRRAAVLVGQSRGIPGVARTGPDGRLYAPVEARPDENPPRARTAEAEREYRAIVEEIVEIRNIDARVSQFVRAITDAGALADTAGYSPDLAHEQKVRLLETVDVEERLAVAIELQREVLAELQVRRRVRENIDDETGKQQRDFFLRKQMDSIRKELGDDEASVVEEYRAKVEEGGSAAGMPEAVREQFERELGRLDRMGEGGMESQTIRSYLDWLLAVPWGEHTEDQLDIAAARTVLDDEHAGLEDVKDRIVEYLSVRKLRTDRAIEHDPKSGAILTLVGPPGTGKTSIGESIAHALGREFVRMSLGGMRDEAEIRGHRRTYVGALPGRLVRALRDAGTMNPVILLDEVDKVGSDWRGDPSSALLEVLDPAQNHTFRDHYLDVDLDLSNVMFIATANVVESIPGPLLDRMEVIAFDGYTVDEKVAIGGGHLWARQRDRAGLRVDEVTLEPEALRTIVTEYTREGGVRQLDRALATVARKTATRIVAAEVEPPITIDADAARAALGKRRVWQESAERTATPGVATGLAVTGTGGDVLFVEATSMPNPGGSGGAELVITGQLGDVMKESAQIALSHVRANADRFGIDQEAFVGRTFHLHVPAGAIPKDGPSAGITMATALVSLLTGRPVRHTTGMTGELTLQGKVLPIGGLKQKVLAAHAAGLTEIVLPDRNRGDLDDVPEEVRAAMTFHPSIALAEVIDHALEPEPATTLA
ncbi:MAG: ATP-dependent protease La [Thermoleophilia bacterium]|nr:ATP-dependent protease La [Thermoleophilia bacterium]